MVLGILNINKFKGAFYVSLPQLHQAVMLWLDLTHRQMTDSEHTLFISLVQAFFCAINNEPVAENSK
jgi:hypothetical protein